jgi:4-diphosphocytidyl-2-C-methyl-D-erythritol kinase
MQSLSLIAPAKLNLFLHINGRRDDGYHELETLFVFLDHGDRLTFTLTDCDAITLVTEFDEIDVTQNLVYRAAQILLPYATKPSGVEIILTKTLPTGGGVGGGSSDAATTLLALNKLWHCDLSNNQLAELGVKLGADVPVFVRGYAAVAQGIGEELTPVEVPSQWYLVVHPNVHVSTQVVFTHPDLPRNTAKLSGDWKYENLANDCEPLVKKLYSEVEKTLKWLLKYGPSRMTGTGACCFVSFNNEQDAQFALSQLPSCWQGFVAKSTTISPAHLELAGKLN